MVGKLLRCVWGGVGGRVDVGGGGSAPRKLNTGRLFRMELNLSQMPQAKRWSSLSYLGPQFPPQLPISARFYGEESRFPLTLAQASSLQLPATLHPTLCSKCKVSGESQRASPQSVTHSRSQLL